VLVTTVVIGSGIAHLALGQPDVRVENLRAFARLYGYVRYFHPSDAAAGLDWDRFAVYGAARVKDAKTPGDLQRVLQELLSPIAPTVAAYPAGTTARKDTVAIPADTTGLKIVAWQHLGVEGGAGSIYRSVGLNRPVNVLLTGGPGILLQILDATPYRGREIRMTASVRTGTGTSRGAAQLWMRVESAGRRSRWPTRRCRRWSSRPTTCRSSWSGRCGGRATSGRGTRRTSRRAARRPPRAGWLRVVAR
jgi:hypothetical protein